MGRLEPDRCYWCGERVRWNWHLLDYAEWKAWPEPPTPHRCFLALCDEVRQRDTQGPQPTSEWLPQQNVKRCSA